MEEYSLGKVHKGERETRNGNVILSTLLIRPREILESVAQSLFMMKYMWHATANLCLLIFEFPS